MNIYVRSYLLFYIYGFVSAAAHSVVPINYNDCFARKKRSHFIDTSRPNYSLYKDLDAYISIISDIGGLGEQTNDSVTYQNHIMRTFLCRSLGEQFGNEWINQLPTAVDVNQDDDEGRKRLPLLEGMFQQTFNVIAPNAIKIGLQGIAKNGLSSFDHLALGMYLRHITAVLHLTDKPNQTLLLKNIIKEDPRMFDYVTSTADFLEPYRKHLELFKQEIENLLSRL